MSQIKMINDMLKVLNDLHRVTQSRSVKTPKGVPKAPEMRVSLDVPGAGYRTSAKPYPVKIYKYMPHEFAQCPRCGWSNCLDVPTYAQATVSRVSAHSCDEYLVLHCDNCDYSFATETYEQCQARSAEQKSKSRLSPARKGFVWGLACGLSVAYLLVFLLWELM